METTTSLLPVQTQTFRARKFILIIPLPLIVGLLLMPRTAENKNYLTIFLIASLALLFFIWTTLKKLKIEIDNVGFRFQSLFHSKEFVWKEVVKIYIKFHHHGKSGSHYWYFEKVDGSRIRFRIILFSRKNLQSIAEAATMKCSLAEIQDKIRNMAEGRFPWYVF
jgi:hypothetical protein